MRKTFIHRLTGEPDDNRQPFLRESGSYSILIGSVIVLLFVLAALFGQYAPRLGLFPHSPTEVRYDRFDAPPSIPMLRTVLDRREEFDFALTEPIPGHIFGTDNDGRDIFIRVMNGASTYLYAGILTVLISLLLGSVLGSVSGYYRGTWSESVSTYITNVLDAYPRIVILIIVAFISNFNLYPIMITLGILNATRVARIVSNITESLKHSDFILAAKEMGLPDLTIIVKHIVWFNCRHLLSIQMIYGFASVILIEATLSYIGYGIGDPMVSWGRMIYEGAGGRYPFNFVDGIYWQAFPPAAAIIGTVLGLNLLGDGLSRRFGVGQINYI
jgi:ABC-type dipeptide/oligopeptide/nickel transport system permease subunit